MYRVLSKCVMLGFALAAPALMAQDMKPAPEPGHAMVSLYRIAPGKQLAFLKWMATRDAIDQQLKLPRAHWYAHMDGDSWDYIAIAPQLTDAQQRNHQLPRIVVKRAAELGDEQSAQRMSHA